MRTRRSFLRASLGAGMLAATAPGTQADDRIGADRLDRVAGAPVLRVEGLGRPVVIAAMDLLRNGREFLVRVRTRDGAEGIAVPNCMHLVHIYPIFVNRIAPFFVGKDARQLENSLLWSLYRQRRAITNTRASRSGSAWRRPSSRCSICSGSWPGSRSATCSAASGAGRSPCTRPAATGATRPRRRSPSSRRWSPRAGRRPSKFRLGGRMSKDADSRPGRTEALIPMVREAFGPGMTLYADANSSYGVARAVEIGRLMERHGYGFLRGAVPVRDDLDATRAVADSLIDPRRRGRAGVERVRLPPDDRRSVRRHRPARPALLRRVHPLDPRRADGPRGRPALHAPHVGLGARVPRRRPLRLVPPESRPVHRVQGERDGPGDERDIVAQM